MIVIENEVALALRPEGVWRVLTDFPRYARWHPFIRLVGIPELDAEIQYVFTSTFLPRQSLSAPARITQLESPETIAWHTGLKFMLDFEERYQVHRHPTGTRLSHRIEYHGLATALARNGITRRSHAMICDADDALRTYIAKGMPGGPAQKLRKRGRR